MTIQTSYNPERQPEAGSWLELPEVERMRMVTTYHMVNREKSGSQKAHAAFHVAVENRIAMGQGPTVRAMERLCRQGLSRHDAIHAVSSVIANQLFEVSKLPPGQNDSTLQTELNAAIERLDGKSWLASHNAK
jgi:hypothetical protein